MTSTTSLRNSTRRTNPTSTAPTAFPCSPEPSRHRAVVLLHQVAPTAVAVAVVAVAAAVAVVPEAVVTRARAISQLLCPVAAVAKEGICVFGGYGGDGLRQGRLQLLDDPGFDAAQ